jgi:hypothetical protein
LADSAVVHQLRRGGLILGHTKGRKPDLSISLAIVNGTGVVARVYDGYDDVEVARVRHKIAPKPACLLAAKRLRGLADAFERLADTDTPFMPDTQLLAQELSTSE